jgi:hypothetical protein
MKNEKCIQYLVEKSERKRSLGRPKSKWENDVKIYPKEVACMCGLESIGAGYDPNIEMNLRLP